MKHQISTVTESNKNGWITFELYLAPESLGYILQVIVRNHNKTEPHISDYVFLDQEKLIAFLGRTNLSNKLYRELGF